MPGQRAVQAGPQAGQARWVAARGPPGPPKWVGAQAARRGPGQEEGSAREERAARWAAAVRILARCQRGERRQAAGARATRSAREHAGKAKWWRAPRHAACALRGRRSGRWGPSVERVHQRARAASAKRSHHMGRARARGLRGPPPGPSKRPKTFSPHARPAAWGTAAGGRRSCRACACATPALAPEGRLLEGGVYQEEAEEVRSGARDGTRPGGRGSR
jgi:hypothetical protein